jgi:putative phosphoesterase
MGPIGVISDTHGLLRPQAMAALQGSALIIHAGDVGRPEILEELRQIAPVIAVRGNVDKGAWAERLPQSEVVEHDGLLLYVLHILEELELDPPTAGFQAVITGHTHRPKMETKEGVLYFNPGSAGPRRFILPTTVGRLSIAEGKVRGEIITLTV